MSVLAAQNAVGGRDDWQTPPEVLERVRRVAPIGLDPATQPSNPTRAAIWCVSPRVLIDDPRALHDAPRSLHVDGLLDTFRWRANCPAGQLAFANPPYSRGELAAWTSRCRAEAEQGLDVIALVPADTSTLWWQDTCCPSISAAVCFPRGRLRFVGAPGPAPFASAIVLWSADSRICARFAVAMNGLGSLWT